MKNIFYGFVIGAGKIIPGVSGSVLAIIFGVYEKIINILTNIKKINFSSFIYLILISIGVFFGIIVFSGFVKWCLTNFYFPIMLLFTSLIIGGSWKMCKQIDISLFNYKFLLIFIFSLFFPYLILYIFKYCFNIFGLGFILYFCLGFIEAFSTIVPGISGTAIYMSIGYYDLILDFFNHILDSSYFYFGFWFCLGTLFGFLILAKIISFLLNNYKNETYTSILGFIFSSIFIMSLNLFKEPITITSLLSGLILFILGLLFMNFIEPND